MVIISFPKFLEEWINLVIGKCRLKLCLEVPYVAGGSRVKALDAVRRELRDGNCSQDADNRNNDQQLDQGKTFSVSNFVKHVFLLSLFLCS